MSLPSRSLLRAARATHSVASTSSLRCISSSPRVRYASVPDDPTQDLLSSAGSSSSSRHGGRSSIQARHHQAASPQERKSLMEDAKERKMRQYEKLLQARAAEEGVESIEALLSKKKAEKDASLAASLGLKAGSPSEIEKKDLELASKIREMAEKEAKRKLESGELDSRPNGGSGDEGPIKPLSKIIDVEKLKEEPVEKISELWTKYHTLKGKLSAVIPSATYDKLISKARRHPQFVLPVPREVVGGEEAEGETSDLAPGQKKQGYEIQFMEWGFLPTGQADGEGRRSIPSTVLFTPLAEYKLRQEFAQPLLVLTHYTDLSTSKGVVLMRGEITSSEEIEATPTGIAAAESAKQKGASEEEIERLKSSPVQSSLSGGKAGKMSQQDAQLLAMTMQRFYLPDVSNPNDASAAKEREGLLTSFHEDKDSFSVQRLCEVAFTL
ncbi:unnamed protein product [Sympodiomycopsis kandeliae]